MPREFAERGMALTRELSRRAVELQDTQVGAAEIVDSDAIRRETIGAAGGNRTRDIQLGKLTFYL